jgi:transcriptional regulator with XRE-family HTH domain
MDPPDPIEAIRFRMEQQGLTRKDLEGIIGTRTRITEVLGRKRGLSIAMIRRLHERLGISASVRRNACVASSANSRCGRRPPCCDRTSDLHWHTIYASPRSRDRGVRFGTNVQHRSRR